MSMRAEDLVLCLAGELGAMPQDIINTIKADPKTAALVREYGKDRASYDQILNAVNSLI